MADSEQIEAAGRVVRVTSPDRLIYEATARTPAITKLQVCGYFAAIGEPMMRAIGDRPTALERWPKGFREGMRLSTGYGDDGDGFYQKRLPKGAPDWVQSAKITFPSGRTARGAVSHRAGSTGVGRPDGSPHLPSLARPASRRGPPG